MNKIVALTLVGLTTLGIYTSANAETLLAKNSLNNQIQTIKGSIEEWGKEKDVVHAKRVKSLQDSKFLNDKNVKILRSRMVNNLLQVEILALKENKTFYMFVDKAHNMILGQGFDKNGKNLFFEKDMSKYSADAGYTIGNGKDHYYLFTDPECPFCRKFEIAMQKTPDVKKKVTIHVFLYPLSFHKEAKAMSQYIMSQKVENRDAIATSMMINDSKDYKVVSYNPEQLKKINESMDKQKKIADALQVAGTPSLFDSEGVKLNWTVFLIKNGLKNDDLNSINKN